MKRNIKGVINAIICSLALAMVCPMGGMHMPHSNLTTEKLTGLLAAKQRCTFRKKLITTTTTTEISEEYELPFEDRPRLSDKLDPESQRFLNEMKAEYNRDMEITVINDTPSFFGLSEQFDPEDPQKVDAFVDHLTIKINGKEIPRNAVEKIRISAKDKPHITFSLGIKNNKLASLGSLFKNAVSSIKSACLRLINPMSIQVTYKCPIHEQALGSDEPLSIATLIYNHREMAEVINLLENPQLYKMVRFAINYGRWPQWWEVEFHLPELKKTT